MNRLSVRRRAELLSLLCEGCSIATVTRHTGAAKMTVLALLREAGAACAAFHDQAVRRLATRRVQADEVWSFVHTKERHVPELLRGTPGRGDAWLWLALDTESKLVVSFRLGCRGAPSAIAFMQDLQARLRGRIQLSTDGHRPYLVAVEQAFYADSVDYAMIASKAIVPDSEDGEAQAAGRVIFGEPDPAHVSTSFIERYNLTVRMTDRRFTRKTNAFSKSLAYHAASVALHVVYYNFVRPHLTLGRTPAMAAGLADRRWYYEDIVELIEARRLADKPAVSLAPVRGRDR